MSQHDDQQSQNDELTEDSLENVAGGQLQWRATNPIAHIRLPGMPDDGAFPYPGTGPTIPEPMPMPEKQ